MLDEVAPEILFVAGAGTVLVCCLMVLVWFVSTREEKFKKKDEDKEVDGGKQNKKKRQHVSPRKKKEITIKSEVLSAKEDDVEQRKSILKDSKDEPSPRPHRVEFQKEVPKDAKASNRTNLPTPYPQTNSRVPSLNKESNEESKTKSTPKEEKKHNQPSPQSKTTDPKPSKAKPATATNSSSSQQTPSLEQQVPKKKTKSKQSSTNEGTIETVIVKDRSNVLFGPASSQNTLAFQVYLNTTHN